MTFEMRVEAPRERVDAFAQLTTLGVDRLPQFAALGVDRLPQFAALDVYRGAELLPLAIDAPAEVHQEREPRRELRGDDGDGG